VKRRYLEYRLRKPTAVTLATAAAPRVGGHPAVVRVIIALIMTLFAAAASPDRAQASFPGENGRFVLTWNTSRSGVSTDFIATAAKAGGDLRVLARCSYECHHRGGDWAPSGRRLVYVNECPNCTNKLVVVRPNGSHRKVIYRAEILSSPVWSPDGRRIAFVEYRWLASAGDWVSDIYVIRRDGTGRTRVTRTRRSEDQLDWSSRNRLVFSKGRALFTMRPSGRALRRLTDNVVRDSQPDWAPGGRRLTFVRGGEIWRMRASGENASMIASGDSPTWAPDGSLIAFVGAADGAIHTVKPSGEDDTFIGSPVRRGRVSELDWQPRGCGRSCRGPFELVMAGRAERDQVAEVVRASTLR